MKPYRIWLLYAVGLLVIILMVWDLIFSDHGYFVFKHEHNQQLELKAEIESLRAEKEKLKAEIIRLREDPRTLEEVIHRELGYVYPDEYILLMPEQNQQQTAPSKTEVEEE